MCTIGKKLLPDRPYDGVDADNYAVSDFSMVPKWKKYVSLAVLLLTFPGMIFENQIGIKLHVTSTVGTVILVILRKNHLSFLQTPKKRDEVIFN